MPYLDAYWRDYVAEAGLALSPTQGGAYPPGVRARRHRGVEPRS